MSTFRPPAPKPKNFEEMAAAWNNPVEFARQKAIYSAQLVDEGCAPLWPDLDQFEDRADLR